MSWSERAALDAATEALRAVTDRVKIDNERARSELHRAPGATPPPVYDHGQTEHELSRLRQEVEVLTSERDELSRKLDEVFVASASLTATLLDRLAHALVLAP